jgi:hypothetical protein
VEVRVEIKDGLLDYFCRAADLAEFVGSVRNGRRRGASDMNTPTSLPSTTRRQLVYKPGDLAKVGQIWIIESLPAGELKTGKRLWEELSDHCTAHPVNIRIGYCEAPSAAVFFGYLDDLRADIEATGRNAIVQIECHGNQQGLGFADGSFSPWPDIKPKLEAINLASRVNLIVVLGCCYGGYFGQTTRLEERSAFCVYLGPNSELTAGMLSDGFLAFYKALLLERDITAAINGMVAAVPNMPYFFATADGLFQILGVHPRHDDWPSVGWAGGGAGRPSAGGQHEPDAGYPHFCFQK